MTGLIGLLAMVFGGIAIWAALQLKRENHTAPPRRRTRPSTRSTEPSDPWGVANMRRGERYEVRIKPRRR
jgi:hypothetical protein